MRRLPLLLLIMLIPVFTFGQSFTFETRVDSLEENYYKLSFSFSDTLLLYEETQQQLPFPFIFATPEDKFSVDSLWNNDARTEFEIYLNTEDSTTYTFIANELMSKDSLYLDDIALINFSTDSTNSLSHTISGYYYKGYNIYKNTGNAVINADNTHEAQLSTVLISLDYDFKYSELYSQLSDSLYKHDFFTNTEFLKNIVEEYALNTFFVDEWKVSDSYISDGYYRYAFGEPGVKSKIPFRAEVQDRDSVLFLFMDMLFAKKLDLNTVNLVKLIEMDELLNVTSDIDNLGIEIILNPTNNEENIAGAKLPEKIQLSAYPNPFNPSTQIQYTLPEAGSITISVFNVLGQQVRTLAEGTRSSGAHTITFNATGLPAGMYVVRLESTGQSGTVFTETKKVMLLK